MAGCSEKKPFPHLKATQYAEANFKESCGTGHRGIKIQKNNVESSTGMVTEVLYQCTKGLWVYEKLPTA